MSVGLPKQIDVRRLAASGGLLEGKIACQADGRLAAMIVACESDIQISLEFGKQEDGNPGIKGRVQCKVSMRCQRCLQPVSVELDIPVVLGIVETELQASLLPDSVEPLICGDGPVDLLELAEDELILTLPLAPMHEHCGIPVKMPDAVADQKVEKQDSPFSVLKDLKHR